MGGTIVLTLIEALLILLALLISKAIRFICPSLDGDPIVAVVGRVKDDVTLMQTVSPPPSYIVSAPPTKYDVFLSFRGEDTRHTFTSYLYEGLCNAQIRTFMDHEVDKGEQISSYLLRTINESKLYVIIFSENYASSSWCMDELVHILECNKKFGRPVIPIFYKVDPSNMRRQNGGFGKGFDVLKQRFKDNPGQLLKWRIALIQSANIVGWDSNCIRPEPELVKAIVKHTLRKLNYESSSHLERLVGISRRIENIDMLLSDADIVGIWGMGGSGKTTLARALFQGLRVRFDASFFVKNVKGQLKRISLEELEQNCLKELLKDEDISIYDIKSPLVTNRLGRKKILLILDDVDNPIIVEYLTEVFDWLGKESRIIITSRAMPMLKKDYAFSTYHLPSLKFRDAICLFRLKAFGQCEPCEGYSKLSNSIVKHCQGNPLALVVLGCFLNGRKIEEWKSALKNLDQDPPKDTVDVLKLSYDGLDDKQKDVFLAVLFFIKARVDISLNRITQLLDSSAHIEISVLREKSLISFDQHDCIVMHNLVKKMGLKIARQQSFSSSKTPVLLWSHKDIYDFLNHDEGTEAIRGMSLDTTKMKSIELRGSTFRKMRNLRFLKFYKSDWRKHPKLNICEDLEYLPEELRFFIWEEYPLAHVPLHFCADNLVELKMHNSNIRQLWDEDQHFPNLKDIDMSDSKHLVVLPDLSHAPKIESMVLDGCVNLALIHSSTVLPNLANLGVGNDGPRRIKIGGSIKGTSSGLVIVFNYLDLEKLSLKKVTLKIFVRGNVITGVGFKHVVMPLEERAELRKGTQRLASLLPFVRKAEWLEGPGVFGDDFNQHFTYHTDYARPCHLMAHDYLGLSMNVKGEVGPLGREVIDDNEEWLPLLMEIEEEELMREEERYRKSSSLMKVEEEDDDELITEYCGSNTTTILTRLPNHITRWSLLTQLRLKESDIIGNAGGTIDQVSILKSLVTPSHDDYFTRIQPLLDVKLSFNDIPPSALSDCSFRIFDDSDKSQHHPCRGLSVDCYGNHDLSVEY